MVCSWFVVLVCVLLMLFCYVFLILFLVLVGIRHLLLYLFLCVACVFIFICVLILCSWIWFFLLEIVVDVLFDRYFVYCSSLCDVVFVLEFISWSWLMMLSVFLLVRFWSLYFIVAPWFSCWTCVLFVCVVICGLNSWLLFWWVGFLVVLSSSLLLVFLVPCSWIWFFLIRICYFFCSLVFVLTFSLFILMCGLNSWFYSLFFVLEFGFPDWKCYWCACRPLLMLLVFVPWCCLLCLNLCWGLDDVHPSLLCVFILLCGLNYWLLFWCLGFLFVLVRHYCSCSLFFVHPFHFFVLASPSIIWKRMCCGPSEKSDYNKSDEPFIDLTERVPCAWMRSQGYTQHVRQKP